MYPQIVAAWDRQARVWRFNGGQKSRADFEAALERGDTALTIRIGTMTGQDDGADIAWYVPLRYESRSPSAVENGESRESYEGRIAARLDALRQAWPRAQADAEVAVGA